MEFRVGRRISDFPTFHAPVSTPPKKLTDNIKKNVENRDY
jgi:hypothetical protein